LSPILPPGYRLRLGSGLDRALLLKFLQRTYSEMAAAEDYTHLAATVDQYLSQETPLWFVEIESSSEQATVSGLVRRPEVIACLWVGTAIDQVQGDRHAHIFLLYVEPCHRRRGIARTLMQQVETWARARGDRQIGLQVFSSNQPALKLYQQLGYATQSLWMVKPLSQEENQAG